jgi:hypothetical protein
MEKKIEYDRNNGKFNNRPDQLEEERLLRAKRTQVHLFLQLHLHKSDESSPSLEEG